MVDNNKVVPTSGTDINVKPTVQPVPVPEDPSDVRKKPDTIETLSIKYSALKDDFDRLEIMVRNSLGNLRRAQEGKVEETRRYCSDCGETVHGAACPAHPAADVNHGGFDPKTGQHVLLRVT